MIIESAVVNSLMARIAEAQLQLPATDTVPFNNGGHINTVTRDALLREFRCHGKGESISFVGVQLFIDDSVPDGEIRPVPEKARTGTEKVSIYDPPSGWRYGFPKPYRPLPGETLKQTLLRDHYPQREIDLGMAEHVRFWEMDEENTQ